jgi:hypothetical protein
MDVFCAQMRCCLETGSAEPVRAPKWSVRRAERTVTAKLTSAVSGRYGRGKRRYISRPERMNVLWGEPTSLLLEHFFDLSDLFLNFTGVFFDVAFGL